MMRIKGWERALNATVARHAALPFSWDVSNCFYFPMDVVAAVTGADPWADQRGCTSQQDFHRRLVQLRFESVAEAFAFKLPEIPVALMGRADIGVIAHPDAPGGVCGVVCLGPDVAAKTEPGMIYLPRGRVTRAFRVT